MKKQISSFWLYKQRYFIAFFCLFVGYIFILATSLFESPSGLTSGEIASSVDSYSVTFSDIFSDKVVNMPFKILQKISISTLGLSNFSVKLPSIILSFASIFAILSISRRVFANGIAILGSILAISSSQFFFVSQNGTPDIMYIFWPAIIILAGLKFMEKKTIKSILMLAISAALSLYTPFMMYVLLAILTSLMLHPKLRILVVNASKKQKLVFFATISVFILPLIMSGSMYELLFSVSNFDFLANLKSLLNAMFGFGVYESGLIFPAVNYPSIILSCIGIYYLLSEAHSAKSQMLFSIFISALLISFVSLKNLTVLFLPIVLFSSVGLQSLIQTWYAIFPRNPYARLTGLIPVAVLIFSIFTANIDNFRQNYMHSPEASNIFTQDLSLILKSAKKESSIIGTEKENRFYEILKNQSKITSAGEIKGENIILTREKFKKTGTPDGYEIDSVIVSAKTNDADRFYILRRKSSE